MSMTSRSYRPSRCSSQIARRFLTARADRGVMPVTYSRRTYRSAGGAWRRCSKSRGRVARVQRSSAVSPAVTQIQPDEHAFRVREVADDLLDRFRQPPHERRHGQDLVAARELRILQQIDDLDLVAPLQMLLADLLQVREGQDRLRRLSRDVEPQLIRLGLGDGAATSSSDSCMAIASFPRGLSGLCRRQPCGPPFAAMSKS